MQRCSRYKCGVVAKASNGEGVKLSEKLIDDDVFMDAISSDWCRRQLALDKILELAGALRRADRKLARLICTALSLDTVDGVRMRSLETLEEVDYKRDASLALRSLTEPRLGRSMRRR